MPERLAHGLFITFEGGEGSGKTTQIARLAQSLDDAGVVHTSLREPGGTRVAERVRELLLDPENSLDPWAELFLYEASRAELVSERIEPALERGEVVLCDRFTDSTLAYQGWGRGVEAEAVRQVNSLAAHGLIPDLTLLIDVDPAEGLARATLEGADRLEAEDLAFHSRVRDGFLAIASLEPERFVIIDGMRSEDKVFSDVVRVVRRLRGLSALRP